MWLLVAYDCYPIVRLTIDAVLCFGQAFLSWWHLCHLCSGHNIIIISIERKNIFSVEPVRGCWPASKPLPLVSSSPSLVSPVCELQETSHVSACLCDTSLCNAPRVLARQPKQIVFPSENSQRNRNGRQSSAGLKCFSCGSLFNRSSPQCDEVTLEYSE